MFLSSRVVPQTPPSLVKSSSMARGVMIGAGSSVPSSDQVPELRNAVVPLAETAANAEPVSWLAGATTGVPASAAIGISAQVADDGAGLNEIRAAACVGIPSSSSRSVAQRARRCVDQLRRRCVGVLGPQAAGEPEIQDIGYRRQAVSRREGLRRRPAQTRRADTSVLNHRNWMPVTA